MASSEAEALPAAGRRLLLAFTAGEVCTLIVVVQLGRWQRLAELSESTHILIPPGLDMPACQAVRILSSMIC